MNDYVIRAVTFLQTNYAGLGYDINKALTHELPYPTGTIKPTDPPRSMCVGGILEVILHALDFYAQENNSDFYSFLPRESWARLRPTDIRSHIWVDPRLEAYGTGDALRAFGIGERLRFSELRDGDFVNINRPPFPGKRSKWSGHAVVFRSYVDERGVDTRDFAGAAGFRYFAHQQTTNGFGERIAIFLKNNNQTWFCPALQSGSADCGVIYTRDQHNLNAGRLWLPTAWNAGVRDEYLARLKERLYEKNRSRSPDMMDLGLDPDATLEEFDVELDELGDVMKVNPNFKNAIEEGGEYVAP